MNQEPVFDKPQWQWSRTYESSTFAGMPNHVFVHVGRTHHILLMNIPAEFVRYIKEHHQFTDIREVIIRVLHDPKVGHRLTYTLEPGEDAERYFLWRMKTLPAAFDPFK